MSKKNATIGIIGLGKFGMCLANQLVKNGRHIICIDKDEIKVKKALDISDFAFVSEDLSTSTLEETGFKECQTIVVCIGEHLDTAIFVTLNALSLNGPKVIAMSNTEEQGKVLEKLGAEVIYPYKDSADRLAKKILTNNVLDFISLNDEIDICELRLPDRYIGTTVKDSDIRSKYGINIIAIGHENGKVDSTFLPEYVFEKGDKLVVIGETKIINKFEGKK